MLGNKIPRYICKYNFVFVEDDRSSSNLFSTHRVKKKSVYLRLGIFIDIQFVAVKT